MINMPGSDLDLGSLQLPKSEQEKQRTELGQEDFLTLMVTQLRNQDPFQPMENGEFLGQMAQFSTVSGIGDMSASLDALAESLYSSQALQASSMIGRSVLTEGNVGRLASDTPLRGAVDVPAPTSDGFVRISTAGGQLVRELPIDPGASGLVNFEWDGLAADGTEMPPGSYVVSAGVREGGEETALGTYVSTRVASVSLSAGGTDTRITTENGDELRLSQVKAVM